MSDVLTPETLEAFAEQRLCVLIRDQVPAMQAEDVIAAHGERENTGERSCIVVRVDRQEEEPLGSGFFLSEVTATVDPMNAGGDWAEMAVFGVEEALGNGDDLLASELTSGRLVCMSGSVEHLIPTEVEDLDGKRRFGFMANLGLLAPS